MNTSTNNSAYSTPANNTYGQANSQAPEYNDSTLNTNPIYGQNAPAGAHHHQHHNQSVANPITGNPLSGNTGANYQDSSYNTSAKPAGAGYSTGNTAQSNYQDPSYPNQSGGYSSNNPSAGYPNTNTTNTTGGLAGQSYGAGQEGGPLLTHGTPAFSSAQDGRKHHHINPAAFGGPQAAQSAVSETPTHSNTGSKIVGSVQAGLGKITGDPELIAKGEAKKASAGQTNY